MSDRESKREKRIGIYTMEISKMMEGENTLLMISASNITELAIYLINEIRKKDHQEKENESYLSEAEVCELLKVTHTTLWRWNKNGILPCKKIGRRTFWRRSDIDLLIAKEG